MASSANPRLMGVDWLVDYLLKDSGLTEAQIRSDKRLAHVFRPRPVDMPINEYLDFFNAAADVMANDSLGLEVGETLELSDYGFFGHLALHCACVKDALDAMKKYMAIMSPLMVVDFVDSGELCEVRYHLLSVSAERSRHDVEMSLAATVRFLRQLFGEDWRPTYAHFKHSAPADKDVYRAVFGEDVGFNQPTNCLGFAANLLEAKIQDTDPKLLEVLRAHADSLLNELGGNDNLVVQVRYHIGHSIGSDSCSSDSIAAALYMSQRTMNRHLAGMGTSFRSLKQDVIMEVAKNALLHSSSDITTIALKLGYSETAAFDHAFRKATGQTPSSYRLRCS